MMLLFVGSVLATVNTPDDHNETLIFLLSKKSYIEQDNYYAFWFMDVLENQVYLLTGSGDDDYPGWNPE